MNETTTPAFSVRARRALLTPTTAPASQAIWDRVFFHLIGRYQALRLTSNQAHNAGRTNDYRLYAAEAAGVADAIADMLQLRSSASHWQEWRDKASQSRQRAHRTRNSVAINLGAGDPYAESDEEGGSESQQHPDD